MLAVACSPPVSAQEAATPYPAKTIRMVVPFPPGGGNDIMGRYLAAKLSERLNRQVIVDNRPGADGVIGSDMVAKPWWM